MIIAVGADHGGFALKEEIVSFLKTLGVNVKDLGTFNEESVDYPDFAEKVALSVSKGESEKGILVCGTGIGMSITANKIIGIRAALVASDYDAEMSARHNNANIITMGGRTTTPDLAKRYIKIWLNTEFEGGRHSRRLSKIEQIEKSKE